MSTHDLSPFESRWLAQAVAEIELRDGRLPDQDEIRQAAKAAIDAEGQIVARGVLLADREGLVEKLHRWLSISRTLMLFLAVLIFFSGVGAALGFEEGGSRQINALWALLALLTPNLIMLTIWAVGFVSAGRRHFGIGALWQWVIAHLPGKASELVQPFLTLHDKAGLTRWWFGTVTHSVWAIATLGMLVGLVGALAFRGYSFVWETTWLTQGTLVSTVNFFGTLPALMGFPIPDESILARSSAPLTDEAARRAWTAWFIGCLTVYGLLPRLALWFICSVRLSVGRRRLRLNASSREYAGLAIDLVPTDTERREPFMSDTIAQEEKADPEAATSPASSLPPLAPEASQDPQTPTRAERFAAQKMRLERLRADFIKTASLQTQTASTNKSIDISSGLSDGNTSTRPQQSDCSETNPQSAAKTIDDLAKSAEKKFKSIENPAKAVVQPHLAKARRVLAWSVVAITAVAFAALRNPLILLVGLLVLLLLAATRTKSP